MKANVFKKTAILLGLSGAVYFADQSLAAGEYRAFKDAWGRVINAELLAVKSGKVALSMKGKLYRIPVRKLSQQDQLYIKQWSGGQSEIEHPLGWKKVNVHLLDPFAQVSVPMIEGGGFIAAAEISNTYYLPIGARITISSGGAYPCSFTYEGESDLYVSSGGDGVVLDRGQDKPSVLCGPIIFHSSKGFQYLSVARKSECADAIKKGATLSCNLRQGFDETILTSLQELRPQKLEVLLSGDLKKVPWDKLPDSIDYLRLEHFGDQALDLTGIGSLPNIKHLSVRSRKITGLGGLKLLGKLNGLILTGEVSADQLKELTNLHHLKSLYLGRHHKEPAEGEKDYSFLKGMAELQSLIIRRGRGPSVNLPLGSLPKLAVLKTTPYITGDAWKQLSTLKNITHLDAVSVHGHGETWQRWIDNGFLKHVRGLSINSTYNLSGLRELEHLNLICSSAMNAANYRDLPRLKSLSLSCLDQKEFDGAAACGAFDQIENIRLNGKFDDLAPLKKFSKVKRLTLGSTTGLKELDLSPFPQVERLDLVMCKGTEIIRDTGRISDLRIVYSPMKSIGNGLANPHLRSLYLKQVKGLQTLDRIASAPELQLLAVISCEDLTNLSGMDKQPKLYLSRVTGSPKLPKKKTPASR